MRQQSCVHWTVLAVGMLLSQIAFHSCKPSPQESTDKKPGKGSVGAAAGNVQSSSMEELAKGHVDPNVFYAFSCSIFENKVLKECSDIYLYKDYSVDESCLNKSVAIKSTTPCPKESPRPQLGCALSGQMIYWSYLRNSACFGGQKGFYP